MIVAGQRLRILIATRPVDFRCGHEALALMVQTELALNPHSGMDQFGGTQQRMSSILVRTSS